MKLQLGRPWEPSDPKELQDVIFRDMAIGCASRIDYCQERFGDTREQARDRLDGVETDNEEFPLVQNPGAMVDGPLPANGEGSATKTPGAFNPDTASSVEGASVTAAAQKKLADGQDDDDE
jgi:hypothetical protein